VGQAAADLAKGEDQPDISLLLAALKAALTDAVSDVRATARLSDSAVVLAADDKGPDLQMQRLMRRAGRAMMPSRPILEVNPMHRLITALAGRHEDEALVAEAAATLLDLALVQEGEPPRDPTAFARRVTTLMAGGLGA
jgi:molecular chaperone HtpG